MFLTAPHFAPKWTYMMPWIRAKHVVPAGLDPTIF